MPSSQLSLFPMRSNKRFFGGSLLHGRRKTPRPLNIKEAIHFVLRSQFGYGLRSFRSAKNQKIIDRILDKASAKYRVKIYRRAVQSNHIHLVLKVPSRTAYKAFIAVISGKIAQAMMDYSSFKDFLFQLALEESCGLSKAPGEGAIKAPYQGQAFWEYRPFSRILYWGKDYNTTIAYLLKNTLEALGFIPYVERKKNFADEKEKRIAAEKRFKKLTKVTT